MRTKLFGDFHRQPRLQTSFHIDHRQFPQLSLRPGRKFSFFKPDVCLLRVALRADRNKFTDGMDIAPVINPAAPATKMATLGTLEAATPIMRLAVETMASSDLSTAARNHPARAKRLCKN
jgi:hypothetical protein